MIGQRARQRWPGKDSITLEKVACGAFSDVSCVLAGKRLLLRILRSQHSHIPVQQRDFCRLPRAGAIPRGD